MLPLGSSARPLRVRKSCPEQLNLPEASPRGAPQQGWSRRVRRVLVVRQSLPGPRGRCGILTRRRSRARGAGCAQQREEATGLSGLRKGSFFLCCNTGEEVGEAFAAHPKVVVTEVQLQLNPQSLNHTGSLCGAAENSGELGESERAPSPEASQEGAERS